MRGVVLRLEDFKRHFYIVGGSRQGKTNLLATIAYYLASPANQKLFPCGLIIIDPHGDLGFQLPMMLRDWDNLRVIDPWYVRFGMNPLQLMPYNTSDEKSIQVQDQISQLILILEDALQTDPARATRMTWIFRGALHYLYHFSDDVTFLDLYNLMHDMMVMERDELMEMLREADIEDDVINKTLEAIITLPEEAFTPVMNRIFNFVVHEGSMASRVFCSRKSTLDWDWMLQPGHVTVIRMEAFNIPGDFRALFTNSFVLKLYFLIQHRAKELEMLGRQPPDRTPLYLIIDEFQTIEKLEALERILSESAKYGLLMGLAHQNMAQLSRRELLQSILANVGLIVSFKVSSDDAAVLARVFGEEWKTVLCEKLRRFEVVTKRTLDDGSAEVVRSMTSLAPPPVHTVEELKNFMRSRMNGMHDWAREDRKPVYRDEQERMLRERRRSWNVQPSGAPQHGGSAPAEQRHEEPKPEIGRKEHAVPVGGKEGRGAAGAKSRGSLPTLRVALVEVVRELEDNAHIQKDGSYRVTFAEVWEGLRNLYDGPPGASGDFVGQDGKAVTMAMVGRVVRERLSGEPIRWRQRGKVARGYRWKEKLHSGKGMDASAPPLGYPRNE